MKIDFDFDGENKYLTIYGVKYNLEVFKIFAEPEKGHTYKFERDGEVVTVTDLGPELETACLAPAQPITRNYERR